MDKSVPALGKHLILDVWGEIGSLPYWNMDEAAELLKQAATHAGATVLTERWHHFGTDCGYTGVIILAESHISAHSWPEKGYVAIDAFMCGDCDPQKSLDMILQFYKAKHHNITLLSRGQ